MTNDIRILSVLRRYYEEKALSTNSQEDAAIHNALLHAIKTLESSIHIPSNATNGDVIKAILNPYKICEYEYSVHVYMTEKDFWKAEYQMNFDTSWWNAPYREGDTSE